MKGIAHAQISAILYSAHPKNYREWKSHRQKVVSSIGQYLITFDEHELNNVYNAWEKEIVEYPTHADRGYHTLLMLSILHYFKRSFDQIRTTFQIIFGYFSLVDHELCRAAGKVLFYIGSENVETFTFLREILELASQFLSPQQVEQMAFSGLTILHQVGRFLAREVYAISLSNRETIFQLCFSKDKEISKLATKVLKKLIKVLHQEGDEVVVKDIFTCFDAKIAENPFNSNDGIITLLHYMYQKYPSVIRKNQFISRLTSLCTLPNSSASNPALEFMTALVKAKELTTLQTSQLIMLLLAQLMSPSSSKKMFQQLIVIMNSVPAKNIPVPSLIQMAQYYVSLPQKSPLLGSVYKVLSVMLDYAVVEIPAHFFCYYGKYCIIALSKCSGALGQHRNNLLNEFKKGTKQESSIKERKLSILIATTFKKKLFSSMPQVFELLRFNAYSSNEKLRMMMAQNMSIFESDQALDELVRMASMDTSKEIRLAALDNLTERAIRRNPNLISQLIADPSFKVRRKAIPIIAECAKSCPYITVPKILTFTNDLIDSGLTFIDPHRSAKMCSLMTLIAKHFVPLSTPLSTIITFLCVKILLGEIPNAGSMFSDLNQQIHRDLEAPPPPPTTPTKQRLFFIVNQAWIDKRDASLFDTLGELSATAVNYMSQIVPAFVKCFNSKTNNAVYLAAINALTKIVIESKLAINIASEFPDLIQSINKLISHSSGDVCVQGLKLTSTIGISNARPVDLMKTNVVEECHNMKDTQFYTNLVMNGLIKMLKEPTPAVFDVITTVLIYDTDNSLIFLRDVLPGYIEATTNDLLRPLIFKHLQSIAAKCKRHLIPFVDIFEPALIKYFNLNECIKLCIILSRELGTGFTPVLKLFPLALASILRPKDLERFSLLMKFAAFAVLFQHQNFGELLDYIDTSIIEFDIEKIAPIFENLALIVQNMPIVIYGSRIARLCFLVFATVKTPEVKQLIYCLVSSNIISVSTVKSFIEDADSKLQLTAVLADPTLVKAHKPVIEELKHKPRTLSSPGNLFSMLPPTNYSNPKSWLSLLYQISVSCSPMLSIRCCLPLIGQSMSFMHEIEIHSFITCWSVATYQERVNFSRIIRKFIENATLDLKFVEFIEQVDKSGHPLLIGDDVLAKAALRMPNKLYFLQRAYLKQKSPQSVLDLFNLNVKMGRMQTAGGIFYTNSHMIDEKEIASCRVKLGEWDAVLEHSKKEGNIPAQVYCLGKMESWEAIRSMTSEYEKFNDDDKEDKALWFAWAFYQTQDNEKVDYYISKFRKEDIHQISFKAMHWIRNGKYEDAEHAIQKGFEILSRERAAFNGSDSRKATINLMHSEHLLELTEVLKKKRGEIDDITEIWENRIANFSHEADSWIKTTEIRRLVLNPEDNLRSYVKTLRVFRKERDWKLATNHIERFFSKSIPPEILIELLKITWEKGETQRALSLCRCINCILNRRQLPKIQEADMELLKRVKWNSSSLNNCIKAKFLRMQATWHYSLYSSKTSTADVLGGICKLFEKANSLRNNDPKTWSGWAYASSRALSHFPEQRSTFTEMSMKCFLTSAKLSPDQSIEFMCQAFSIFFRYGAETGISDSLRSKFETLPPTVVNLIVPQIAVHIADSCKIIRDVVQNIIVDFGEKYFEAVLYQLNVLTLINDEEKASVARDILEKLGQKNSQIYAEAKLFIDGLHRSAVSWFEIWMKNLDLATAAVNDKPKMYQILMKLLDLIEHPKCSMDRVFIKKTNQQIVKMKTYTLQAKKEDEANMAKGIVKETNTASMRGMWAAAKDIYMVLDEIMKMLRSFKLSSVSQELAQKNGSFSLAVPGKYSIDEESAILHTIDDEFEIMNTQQHPRTTWMTDTQGVRRKFLLKGNEDLRMDQRIMHFFTLINSMFKAKRTNAEEIGFNIMEYSIIPFAPNAGLVSWVTGADTMHKLINEYRTVRDIRLSLENDIVVKNCGNIINSLSALQRYEVFTHVEKETNAFELREMIWLRSPSSLAWLQRMDNFTVSTALMSMAGYIIGLGDRHPSNIMVQRHTGKIVHIDFGDSFEAAMKRNLFPERVPFRLTRMIQNALDGGVVNGYFRKRCEDAMWILRNGMSSIVAQLEVFIHEPIFSEKDTIMNNDEKTKKTLERISSKLSGTDIEEGVTLDIHSQVTSLIKTASDPKEYVRHYIGWCPFW